jgi:hypothetical protein
VQVNLALPTIFMCGCVFLVVVPMIAAPIDAAIGLGIMFTGVPVYALFIYWKNKPAWLHNLVGM